MKMTPWLELAQKLMRIGKRYTANEIDIIVDSGAALDIRYWWD